MGDLKGLFKKVDSLVAIDEGASSDERVIQKQKETWIPSNIALIIIYSLFTISYFIKGNIGISFWMCLAIAGILLFTLGITTILYKNKDEALEYKYILYKR